MQVEVRCPHGVRVKMDDVSQSPPLSYARYMRLVLRDALLACPECQQRAEGCLGSEQTEGRGEMPRVDSEEAERR